MKICLIVAMDERRAIGFKKGIPWRIPGEQRIFRDLTLGNGLILGRRTYESIGRPLPGRTTIVMSRHDMVLPAGVLVAKSVGEAIELARSHSKDRICVGGGADIYRAFMPHADTIYLTQVHAIYDGDTFFPEMDSSFILTRSTVVAGTIPYTYQTFERG